MVTSDAIPDGLSRLEIEFIQQRHEFLELALSRYPSGPSTVAALFEDPPQPLDPIRVRSLDDLQASDTEAVAQALHTGYGVANVVPESFSKLSDGGRHQLLALADQLRLVTPIGYPVEHPMEAHPEAAARFGPRDGTLKIYDLPVSAVGPRYREQAETNEMFDAHNDGLGYAGLIRTFILTADSPPLAGGYTFFQNLVRLAPTLARDDPQAYAALFLPDAITAIRPRGKGAIKVDAPVLFLGRDGAPQTFFRITTGEYRISWRPLEALDRARSILERLTRPFAPQSRFAHLMRPGETVIADNRHVVHGRTPFWDPLEGPGRVLARKWLVSEAADAAYRHVPAIYVDARWAQLLPDIFAEDRLTGDWHYDAQSGENVRSGDLTVGQPLQ